MFHAEDKRISITKNRINSDTDFRVDIDSRVVLAFSLSWVAKKENKGLLYWERRVPTLAATSFCEVDAVASIPLPAKYRLSSHSDVTKYLATKVQLPSL